MNQADRDRLVALKKAKKKLITQKVLRLLVHPPIRRCSGGPPADEGVRPTQFISPLPR